MYESLPSRQSCRLVSCRSWVSGCVDSRQATVHSGLYWHTHLHCEQTRRVQSWDCFQIPLHPTNGVLMFASSAAMLWRFYQQLENKSLELQMITWLSERGTPSSFLWQQTGWHVGSWHTRDYKGTAGCIIWTNKCYLEAPAIGFAGTISCILILNKFAFKAVLVSY